MTGWSRIVGHQDIIQYIEQVTKTGTPSHAYIISGEHGSGKSLLSKLFAMALTCENREESPCMECRSCKQAAGGNHPDIRRVTHEKPGTISVSEIREQVVADILIRPYQSPYKVYLIEEAEKMTAQAQNALLKTLEEPPAYAVILLLTTNEDLLLQTIRSRCVLLKLRGVKDSLVKKYLMDVLGVDEHRAEICASFAQGNIGRGAELAQSDSFREMVQDMLQLLKYIDEMEVSEIMAALKEVQKYKITISDFFDLMAVYFRDVLLFKATGDINQLVFCDEVSYIRDRARKSSYEGIETILEALRKAKERLAANVNFDLTAELLILSIKEN